MNLNPKPHIVLMSFSPAGGTRRVLGAMADSLADHSPSWIDLTRPDNRRAAAERLAALRDTTHILVGAPVYAGRLPEPVAESLRQLEGRNLPTAAVVVYGNRDVGDALRQLVQGLLAARFRVTAAAAFVAEHSLSSIMPVATARPDEDDLARAGEFARGFASARSATPTLDARGPELPGRRGLVDRLFPPTGPRPELSERGLCTDCGACVRRCTMGVLHPETKDYMNRTARKRCLGCQACVVACKAGVRACHPPAPVRWIIRRVLREASVRRREPWTSSP